MIKILDSSFKRLGVIKNTLSSSRIEEINGANTLDFSAIIDSKMNTLVNENSVFELEGEYFDVAIIEKVVLIDNTYLIKIEAEHISYRLNDPDLNMDYFSWIGTPTEILTEILADTSFTIGTIEYSTEEMTFSSQEAKSRRGVLMEFVAYLEGEVKFTNTEIDILQHRGSTDIKRIIKGKNLNIISHTVNKREKDKDGNHLISYTCEPVYLPDESYSLGDDVLLIQNDLNIREELRVTKISYNPYNIKEVTLTFANYVNELADSLYRIETETVKKDKIYHGCRIGPTYGFEVERSDKEARAYFRSDEMVFQAGDGEGNYTNMLYYGYHPETNKAIMYFNGLLTVEAIEAIKANINLLISQTIIVNNLYAQKAYIAQLTVDELDTSTKIKNYLETEESKKYADVNYIKIYKQNIEFITAMIIASNTLTVDTNPTAGDTMTIGTKVFTFVSNLTYVDGEIKVATTLSGTQTNIIAAIKGTDHNDPHPLVTCGSAFNTNILTISSLGGGGNLIATTETFTAETNIFSSATLELEIEEEQVRNRENELLWWVDDNYEGITTEETDYPVMQFIYNELMKMKFEFEDIDGTYIPVLTLGAGTGSGNNGKAHFYKTTNGVLLRYTTRYGKIFELNLDDSAIYMKGEDDLSFYNRGSLRNIAYSDQAPSNPQKGDLWIEIGG